MSLYNLILASTMSIFILMSGAVVGISNACAEESKNGYAELINKAERYGAIRVIIDLYLPNYRPDAELSKEAARAQQKEIARRQEKLLGSLAGFNPRGVKKFKYTPSIAMEVDKAALLALISKISSDEVNGITEDTVSRPMNRDMTPAITPNQP